MDVLEDVVDVVDRQAEGLRHPELPVVVLNHKESQNKRSTVIVTRTRFSTERDYKISQ